MDMNRPTPPHGLIAVIRSDSGASARTIGLGLVDAGIRNVEVTTTVPGAFDLVGELSEMSTEVVVGVGTLLNGHDTERAVEAGAAFLVAPNTSQKVIETAREVGRPVIPGALTPTEVAAAWDLGASAVKVFPANSLGGPSYTKALTGPLPHIPLVASGGVGVAEVGPFLHSGCVAVCVGGALIDANAAADGDREGVARKARSFLTGVQEIWEHENLPDGVDWTVVKEAES